MLAVVLKVVFSILQFEDFAATVRSLIQSHAARDLVVIGLQVSS